MLELFGKKHTGIFSIMDEQGMLGSRATDADLIRRIFETHSGKTVASQHSRFAKPRFDKESFIVKHYAGTYGVRVCMCVYVYSYKYVCMYVCMCIIVYMCI